MWAVWILSAGAQDLDQLDPGPYAIASYDWEWNRLRTTRPDTGAPWDVRHYGQTTYPLVDGEVAPGPLPVVVFGHGRFHSGPTLGSNHLEAAYLMERLASWGVVAVSVNLDVVGEYSFPAAIPQRGEIVRQTLTRLYDLEAQPGSPPAGLAEAIDTTRAVLIGHSRGGEGVVAAAVQNLAAGSPLPIVAVGTIAPTNFDGYRLSGIPYMGLYGSKDGDVSDGSPIRLHDQTDAPERHFQYIHGANHFWFTESITYSGEGDADISRALHHGLAMGYLAGFAVRELQDPSLPGEVFVGPEMDRLTSVVEVVPQYRAEARLAVDGFELERAVGTTDAGTRVFQRNWRSVSEVSLNDSGRTLRHATNGVELTWNGGTPGYWLAELPGAPLDATEWTHLHLSALQVLTSSLNPDDRDQDLSIAVRDADGELARVAWSSFGRIVFPLTHDGGWFSSFPEKSVLQTVRVPLAAFEDANPRLDLTRLVAVGVRADRTGSGDVILDNVELAR